MDKTVDTKTNLRFFSFVIRSNIAENYMSSLLHSLDKSLLRRRFSKPMKQKLSITTELDINDDNNQQIK
jgi:hypothetical protein